MEQAASYFDGSAPLRRSVLVRADGDVLVITAADDGRPLARWPVSDVRLVDSAGNGGDLRLRCGTGDDRLVLEDRQIPEWLAVSCPNLRSADAGDGRFWRRLAFWTAGAAVAVIVLIRVVIPALAGQIVSLVPESVEQQFGERIRDRALETLAFLDKGGEEALGACTSPDGLRAVETLAQTLAAGLESPPPITVTVVRTKMVNAIALPGGQIVVFKGLLDFAKTGNELAGVLAHEIAHVGYRHPLHFVIEEAATNALIGIVLGDVFGGGVIAGVTRVLVTTQYTRDMEREADAKGVELMNRAGLDALGLATALERLGERYANLEKAFAYVSTHPLTSERTAAIRGMATGGRDAFTKEEWAAVKAMCDDS